MLVRVGEEEKLNFLYSAQHDLDRPNPVHGFVEAVKGLLQIIDAGLFIKCDKKCQCFTWLGCSKSALAHGPGAWLVGILNDIIGHLDQDSLSIEEIVFYIFECDALLFLHTLSCVYHNGDGDEKLFVHGWRGGPFYIGQ